MIKPDFLCVWPRAFDYPLFRKFIVTNRNAFGKVIISFTHNNVDRDYRRFLKKTHPDWTFVDAKNPTDWYNDAVNIAVDASNSKYILFMEQDFICNSLFLNNLLIRAKDFGMVAYNQSGRYHMACCLVKRNKIEETHRFFGQYADYRLDCFDFFMAEMRLQPSYCDLEKLGLQMYEYIHLNGLTHNYRLAIEGQLDLIFNMDEFKEYNDRSLEVDIKQTKSWIKIMKKIKIDLTKYEH